MPAVDRVRPRSRAAIRPTHVAPRFLAGPEATGIGIVAPFDLALDRELWQWSPDDVPLYITRLPYVDEPVGIALAEAVSDHALVTRACRDVSGPGTPVTAYVCTSGSFVGGLSGEAALRAAMVAGGATLPVTTSGALLEALAVLGVTRVGIGTPYDFDLTTGLMDFLDEADIETVAAAWLGLTARIPRVSPEGVYDLALAAAHDDAEAVFLSCTNLPTIDVITDLERILDRPVLSANLVTMWSAARLLGRMPPGRTERLFQTPGVPPNLAPPGATAPGGPPLPTTP